MTRPNHLSILVYFLCGVLWGLVLAHFMADESFLDGEPEAYRIEQPAAFRYWDVEAQEWRVHTCPAGRVR